MPRKIKAKDVQRARRDWYVYHFDRREQVKAMPQDDQERLMTICATLPVPQMTVFGSARFDHIPPSGYKLASYYGYEATLLNPWYLTEDGWDEFQRLWAQLPEPVDLYTPPCVQIGELYTLSTGDEIETP